MPDSYSLPQRKARACRIVGILFLLLAALTGGGVVVIAVAPTFMVPCAIGEGCKVEADAADFLTPTERAAVVRTPAARAGFDAYVARPEVSIALAAAQVLEQGPLILLFLGVGMTLRRLGARGDHVLSRALPWLKRASRAAIVWAVAKPLVGWLRLVLLYPGTQQAEGLTLPLKLDTPVLGLLLAAAAYATAWALEAGIRAERDLADFV